MTAASLSSFWYSGDFERVEFRRMLIISIIAHLIVMIGVVVYPYFNPTKRYVDLKSKKALNVMWARPVGSPRKTPKHKLPGPIVRSVAPTTKPKAKTPKMVLSKKKADASEKRKKKEEKAAREEEKAAREEERRKKAMRDAVAAVTRDVEARPAPRADNFPSPEGDGTGGTPGTNGNGIAGMLGGDPVFGRYKNEVRETITNNFVWLQKTRFIAEISFKIDLKGNILDAEIVKGSGNSSYDQAALRAVRRSSPLSPPPSELARDILREEFLIKFEPELK